VIKNSKNLRGFASLREHHRLTRRRGGAEWLLLAAAFFPTAVVAQNTDVDTVEEEERAEVVPISWYSTRRTDIIVTATGSTQVPEDSGLAISLIEKDDIERLQPSNIADLLTRTPGVTVSNTGPIGGFSAVRIRGAEGEQTLALIDGVRLNDPSSPGGGFDFGNLLVGNIQSVEVLRGPNSVPWGSQAIGGVVNIITRRPAYETEGSARAEYGSNDRANLVGNISSKVGPVGFSLGGGYFRDDGISAAASGSEADGYRQYGANGRVELSLSDNASIDLRGYYADARAEADGFPAPTFSLADTLEYSKTQQLTGYAGLNLALGDLKNRLAFTISDINRDNFASPAAATVDFLARGRSERFEYQGDWRIADSIRTVFGAEHERSKFTDGFSPAKTRSSGAYAQAIITPVEQITLTAGGRIDDYNTYGSKATFSANAVWRARDNTTIRAAYGEGFKAPTLFQLFSFFGDPTLQPEEAKSYELGFEQRVIDGQLRFGATAYRRRVRNMIDFDLSTFTYNNIRRAKAKGVEAFIEMTPGERLTIAANYSYTDSKTRLDTAAAFTRRIRVPVHSLNLSADWTPMKRLKLGTDVRLASDSLDGFGGSVRMDGYVLLGARASFAINDIIELYGRVENAGDTDYQTVAGYNAYGRNAHIGLRARF
jgi:vitamin B12 transporter